MRTKSIKGLLSDSVVYGLSGAITKFLSFLLIPIYTKVLSPADYGLLAISTRFYSILLIIVVLGLDSAVYRFFFDTDDQEKRKNVLNSWALIQLSTTVLICVILIVFGDFVGEQIIKSGEPNIDRQIIFLICGSLMFGILPAIVNAYFRLRRMAWHAMIFALLSSLVTIGLSVYWVLYAKKGIVGILSAQCVALFLASGVGLYVLRDIFSIRDFNLKASRSLVIYGISILPSSLSTVGMQFIISLVLQYELSKTALGLFYTGSSFASALTLITTSFSAAWSPFIFSMIKDENFEKTLIQAHSFYLYTMGFISFLMFTFSKEVLQLLTAPSYYAASWVLGIQAYVTFIGSLSVFYILGMSIEKKMKFYPISTITSSILTVGASFFMVNMFGIEGVSLAMLLGQTLLIVMILYFSQKLHPLPFKFGKPIVVVLGMVCIAIVLRIFETGNIKFDLLYKGGLSMVVFFLVFFITKIYKNINFSANR